MLITIVLYVYQYILLWTFWPFNCIWNLKSIFPQAFKDNAPSSGGELTMNILITNSYRSSTNVDHQLIFMFIPFFHPTILKATAEAISVCGTGHQSDPALAKCPTNKLPHSCSWQLLMKIADDIVDDIVHNKCQMSNQQIATFIFLTIVDDSVHNVCWWQYLWQLPNSKFPHSCRWQLLWVMMITFHTFCKFFSWKF